MSEERERQKSLVELILEPNLLEAVSQGCVEYIPTDTYSERRDKVERYKRAIRRTCTPPSTNL